MRRQTTNLSCRIYEWLLFAYPSEFRQRFGPQMVQVFRDCYYVRERPGDVNGIVRLWFRTLSDLVVSAVQEHSERKSPSMNNLKKDLIAISGCVFIIATAFILLSYGRSHEVSSILVFGYILDALATAGIVGNFIVFLLAKITKLNSLRVAFWTFLVVHAVPPLFLALVAGRNDPRFNLGAVVVGYVVSFLFWMGLHWMWSKTTQSWSRPLDQS